MSALTGDATVDAELSDAVLPVVRTAVREFKDDLVSLSFAQADRQGLDGVSVKHVLDAAAFLRTRPVLVRSRLFGMAGGFLLGAAIGNVPTLMFAQVPSHGAIAMTLAFAIVGAVGVTANALRDR